MSGDHKISDDLMERLEQIGAAIFATSSEYTDEFTLAEAVQVVEEVAGVPMAGFDELLDTIEGDN